MLVDIRMPKVDGFEFYHEIRKNDIKVKICFITAFAISYEEISKILPPELVRRQNIIHKPIGIKELVNKINEILRRFSRGKSPVRVTFDLLKLSHEFSPSSGYFLVTIARATEVPSSMSPPIIENKPNADSILNCMSLSHHKDNTYRCFHPVKTVLF